MPNIIDKHEIALVFLVSCGTCSEHEIYMWQYIELFNSSYILIISTCFSLAEIAFCIVIQKRSTLFFNA